VIIHVDGAHNWKTGGAAAGAVAFEDGKPTMRCYRYFPKKTHNQAEYLAVILGIRLAYQLEIEEPVLIITDSQLVAKCFAGEWKQSSPLLRPYLDLIREKIQLLPGGVDIAWERGEKISPLAHDAAQKAMALRNREIRWETL